MLKINSLQGFENIKDMYCMYKRFSRVYFKNIKTKKMLKPFKKEGAKNGYLYLKLRTNNKKEKNIRVHRLIAIAYIENKDGLDEVHHKDDDRENNKLDNLQWVDRQENMHHVFNKEDYLDGDELPLPF